MHNADFFKLTPGLTSTDERTDSSIQNLIHSSGSPIRSLHTFKKVDHNRISLDFSYVSSYNSSLHYPSPRNMKIFGKSILLHLDG
jgi:hypothetical protein